MIGNREDAAAALEAFQWQECGDVLSFEGSSRIVYLINGVVYKVEFGHDGEGCNRNEYGAMSAGNNLPENVFYPAVSLYDIEGTDVIAMEYIEGQAIASCWCDIGAEPHLDSCMSPEEYALIGPYLDDTGGMNVIRNDKGYWIVDAAD